MSAVFTALATSVDGYITGPDPSPDQPLGRGGNVLFDWYGDGDTPSREFPSFRLSTASADVPAPGVTHLHYDIEHGK